MESLTNKTFLARQLEPEFFNNFKKERHEDILVEIVKAKEIDFNKTMHFKDVLDEDISEGYRNIIVDLSECHSIDSSFLGMLVQANKMLKLNNGHMKIIGLNASSDNILIFSGFTKLFQVFNNKQVAIQSCAA
jgi:anti-anti-sigma factor